MIPSAKFGVRAPDKAIFVQSWIDAGIWTAPGEYTAEYPGIFCNIGSWHGLIPGVSGWHTNVIVYGQPLLQQFTNGLTQHNEDGSLKPVWDRTWAAAVFQLTWQAADIENGFPAGYRSAVGVTYADADDFTSPSNIIV